MERERYPLTYRAAEVHRVLGWVKAGQSGCLIGLRGAGKSNLLHYLLRQDVRRHHLGQDYADCVFIFMDLYALFERTPWAFYELILDRLLGQFGPLGIDRQLTEEMASLHRDTTRSRDPLSVRRAVEMCVNVLCRRPKRRLILLFDEFDVAFHNLDPAVFRWLRSLRDAHKGQVCYIVVVVSDLASSLGDLTEVEHFYRLVSRNVCALGPYGATDAQWMIDFLASQRSVNVSERDTVRLIELTGGHAGLLKVALSALWDRHQEGDQAVLVTTLKDEPAVQAECRKVWESLSEGEQAALCTAAAGAPADPYALSHLKHKGLIKEGRIGALLFSPLFADYVRQQVPPSTKGMIISRVPPAVQIDGRQVEKLTELEFEMLCYLFEHRGRVCTKDDLIENVYRQQYDRMKGGVTDGALQTLVSRLRDKIEPDRRRPRFVVTVRGEGYRFVEPDEG